MARDATILTAKRAQAGRLSHQVYTEANTQQGARELNDFPPKTSSGRHTKPTTLNGSGDLHPAAPASFMHEVPQKVSQIVPQ